MPAPIPHIDRDPDYVYAVTIATTPEALWATLTDGRTERPYWAGSRHESTFEPGAAMVWHRNGRVDVRGEILVSEPPRRLVYTFHVEGPGPMHDEGPSVVEYRIERDGGGARLTVLHTNFPQGSAVRASVARGWPGILTGLKAVFEGGEMPDRRDWACSAAH